MKYFSQVSSYKHYDDAKLWGYVQKI